MTKIARYPQGQISWIELASADPAGSSAFYHALLGWQGESMRGPSGPYTRFFSQGAPVAGMTGLSPDASWQRASWSCYFSVDDAAATVEAATKLGAKVVMAATQVGAAGRMAILSDPQGVRFSLWQAQEHLGSAIINEPGSMCWHVCATPNAQGAIEFYKGLFGLIPSPPNANVPGYHELRNSERPLYGVLQLGRVSETFPACWNPYITVADCDASTARALELGAELIEESHATGRTRLSILRDPQGAPFRLMQRAAAQ